MISPDERKRIVEKVSRLAFESTSPETLGQAVMPLLRDLVDASATIFCRVNEHGHLVPLAGTLIDAAHRYSHEYYATDPLQAALRNDNPWLFRTERSPSAWQSYLKGPIYSDFGRALEIHSFIHVRLVDSEHGACGMYSFMLARGERQPPFSTQDELDLLELLPALERAVRRGVREHNREGSALALEAALNSSRGPTVVLDARGGLLWASRHARSVFGWNRAGRTVIPRALLEGALELGALIAGERTSASPTRQVQLVGLDGESVAVDLRIARTDAGVPVIVAKLDVATRPRAEDLASHFNLTLAQASVLMCLAEGYSDRSIAERHSISIATVRSHLGQILSRLGVESRLQAALVAVRYSSGLSAPEDDADSPLGPPT